jgi:hypothetical protein
LRLGRTGLTTDLTISFIRLLNLLEITFNGATNGFLSQIVELTTSLKVNVPRAKTAVSRCSQLIIWLDLMLISDNNTR